MPGASPKSPGSVWAEALPDVRSDATPRDTRILAFYDRLRTPVEKLVKRFDETGRDPEGYRMRYGDTDALLQMEELLPTRDPDILRNFEARRILR